MHQVGDQTRLYYDAWSTNHQVTFSVSSSRRIANVEGSVVTYGLSDRAEKVGEPIGEVWLWPGCAACYQKFRISCNTHPTKCRIPEHWSPNRILRTLKCQSVFQVFWHEFVNNTINWV